MLVNKHRAYLAANAGLLAVTVGVRGLEPVEVFRGVVLVEGFARGMRAGEGKGDTVGDEVVEADVFEGEFMALVVSG
jgi:hypothetical protein